MTLGTQQDSALQDYIKASLIQLQIELLEVRSYNYKMYYVY